MNHRVPNNNIPFLGLGSFNPRTYTCAEFGGGGGGGGGGLLFDYFKDTIQLGATDVFSNCSFVF